MKDKKTIVIDLNLTRGLVALLVLALLGVALLGYLAWGQREVAASGPQAPLDLAQDRPLAQSSGMRQYYLTTEEYVGDQVLSACDGGYHMASLWEIMDPSNLKYNTELGLTRDDSGQGPPAGFGGRVRTGASSLGTAVVGQANCNAWESNISDHEGADATLTSNWTAGLEDLNVWYVYNRGCDDDRPVWCVED